MSSLHAPAPYGGTQYATQAFDTEDDGTTTVVVTLGDPRTDAPPRDKKLETRCEAFFTQHGLQNAELSNEPDHDDAWTAVLSAFEAHCLVNGESCHASDSNFELLSGHETQNRHSTNLSEIEGRTGVAGTLREDENGRRENDDDALEIAGGCFPTGALSVPEMHDMMSECFVGMHTELRDQHTQGDESLTCHAGDEHVLSAFANAGAPGNGNLVSKTVSSSLSRARPPAVVTSDPPPPDSAADLVRLHAARALRSLIFGRDDGRGRRRVDSDGDRVSLKKPKRKGSGSGSANDRELSFDTGDCCFSGPRNDGDNPVVSRQTSLANSSKSQGTLAGMYLSTDPGRWADARTTESSVSCVESMAATALGTVDSVRCVNDGAAISNARRKITALRDEFSVELTRLATVETELLRGVHGALTKWGHGNRGDDDGDEHEHGVSTRKVETSRCHLGSSPKTETETNSVFGYEKSHATDATKNATGTRFRECRFRILGTFETDSQIVVQALVGAGVGVDSCSLLPGNDGNAMLGGDRNSTRNTAHTTKFEFELNKADTEKRRGETLGSPKRRKQNKTHLGALTYLERSKKEERGKNEELLREVLGGVVGSATGEDAQVRAGASSRCVHGHSGDPFPEKGTKATKIQKKSTRHSDGAKQVLETWLARNFYPTPERQKPVPTKGERQALAKETGLTERQVCDWFVNARARVWKPEMQALLLEMETE